MVTNLDQFLNDKKEKEFAIKGKVYKAKLTADILLKFSSPKVQQLEDPIDQIKFIFELVFGKGQSEELFELLNAEGINFILQDIMFELGINQEESNKKK